jgi:diguanylate cyclase (GGDEF)-like protein/PAS domain S-box-containing protein
VTSAPTFSLSTRVVARVAAALWVGCGALVAFAIPLLPLAPGAERLPIVLAGLFAVAVGAIVWFLPWDRWPHKATLVLVPLAFGVIAVYDAAAANPWSHAVFFLVAFAWVGLAHPPGTATMCIPVFVVAYLVPLIGRDVDLGVASLAYVLPTSVLLGESVSWVSARLRHAEEARARSQERFEALVRHANEYVLVIDRDTTITFASAAVERVLGTDPASIIGVSIVDLVHPDDYAVGIKWFDALENGGDLQEVLRYRMLDGSGAWRWIEGTISDLRHEPSIDAFVVNGQDIERRVAAEERLEHLASHDPLTSLPNRAALLEHLGSRGSRAVVYVDLDGFKVVNDSLGHAVGDEVLVAVAERFRVVIGTGELLARLGGDEFMVVVADVDHAVELAEQLLDALRTPLEIAGRRHVVSASIGIADGTEDGAELIRRADLAMYRAKELGRARYEVFDQMLANRARRRLDVEAELRMALDNDELRLHLQPEVELRTGRVVGMEALVRWEHPVRGLLPPAEFIDVAEASDLIVGLGTWVLEEACGIAAQWLGRFGADAPRMSVNVSMRQLHDPGFVDIVKDTLARSALPASQLRLEVTESMLADARAPEVLGELQQLGISVAIDDFGTGYSSLSYLDRLPVDIVKIDRSFLQPVLAHDDRAPVVEATIAMAKSLGLGVVAEGVETTAHVGLLLRLGCGHAQGYLFSAPAPQAEAERMIVESARTQPAPAPRHPVAR